jgi:AMMECR1 domain-containing protein
VRTERHPWPPFAWKSLRRRLGEDTRAELTASVLGLLRFQETLKGWRPVRSAPDATPFVSLYVRGQLRGCYGCADGPPAERLVRAFFRAANDGRFAALAPEERGSIDAQVSYPRRPLRLDPETAADEVEVGTQGVAFVRDRAPAVIVLPHVARDERLGARELLAALLRKARSSADALRDGALYAFETEDVVISRTSTGRRPRASGTAAAAEWLATLVDAEGAITFAIDSRSRRPVPFGEMHHGRAAVVIQALAAHGKHPSLVMRARRRLAADIRAGLGGAQVDGWSDNPELVAGTLALAVLAGVPLVSDLLAFIGGQRRPRAAWHAAQVVAALGRRAPDDLWAFCIADLDRRPFAPWTLIAADARGDRVVSLRVARVVADGLRVGRPHRGGASMTPLPETALTALCVEALARQSAPWSRAAVARGREFVARRQLLGPLIPAALDPRLAHGAFSASPVVDLLRCDITAHALLAMTGSGERDRIP